MLLLIEHTGLQACPRIFYMCGSLAVAGFSLSTSLLLLQQLHHRTLRTPFQLVQLGAYLTLEVPVGFFGRHARQHILCVRVCHFV